MIGLRIFITSNGHKHYDRTGVIVGVTPDRRHQVRIPNERGAILTYVREGEWKPTKIQ